MSIDPYCNQFIVIQHENREYHIFDDGAVFRADPENGNDDIPALLFSIRDAYINYIKEK